MEGSGVKRTSVEAITGESPFGYADIKPAFPRSLGPLPLSIVSGLVLGLTDTKYKAGVGSQLADINRLSAHEGPRAPYPAPRAPWPGKPSPPAVLGYPLDGIEQSQLEQQLSFLCVSTSPPYSSRRTANSCCSTTRTRW